MRSFLGFRDHVRSVKILEEMIESSPCFFIDAGDFPSSILSLRPPHDGGIDEDVFDLPLSGRLRYSVNSEPAATERSPIARQPVSERSQFVPLASVPL